MAEARFISASTAERTQGGGFAYWQALHPRSDLTLPDPTLADDFHGEMITGLGADGTAFCHYESDPVIVRFGRPGADAVMVGVLWRGSMRIRHGHESPRVIGPGSGLFVIDGGKAVTLQSLKRTSLSYLAIPRARAIAAIDADISCLDRGVLSLGSSGLPGFLIAMMRRMRREGLQLNGTAAATVLETARVLGLGCLSRIAGEWGERSGPTHPLVAAVRAYIERHAGEPMLTAAAIAAALGCSRAHLYRALARDNLSVGILLRAARLERACQLLRVRKLSIDQIAIASGYGSTTAFGRAFRARFGTTPARWRKDSDGGVETRSVELRDE